MISNIGTMNAYSYNSAIGGTGSNKIYVPVNPNFVVHAQLEHISGVAAKNNQEGINITKIQILNTLIDQVATATNKSNITKPSKSLNNQELNFLISDYHNQINHAISLAESNPFMPGPIAVQNGSLFSISV